MKSNELARLADVTVRTLRHYHQVGVLQEPHRGSNGYREYTVHDLVRLLRIKRLASLGIPLDGMAAVLDAETDDHASLLDTLDASIDAEIARLQGQKSLIALIRAHESAPDVPPELSRFIDLFAGAPDSASSQRLGREQAVLVAHLLDDDGLSQAVRFYEHLAAPALFEDMLAMSRRFDELDGDPDSTETRRYADEFIAMVQVITATLPEAQTTVSIDERTAMELVLELQKGTLNSAQDAAMKLITAGLT